MKSPELLNTPAAVFFDFDGVLAESVAIKTDIYRELFAACSPDAIDAILEINREMGAVSRVMKIERMHRDVLGKPLSAAELEQWAARYVAIVEQAVIDCPEVPGAEALLKAQAVRSKLFVISGTPEDEMNRIVRARGWERFFVSVHGSPRFKPEIVAELLDVHDLSATDCLFVGDTFTDRDAALAHDIPFVGRRPVVRENPFPSDTLMVDDMTGLLNLIETGARR
ncbi:MAG: HAD family hydrolase [Rhodospirillaceae bacterium]|nr:HAD family hydrolase [Rhodospirillaceae bacterium]